MTKRANNITIQHIDTRLIVESPLNPRKHFSLTELQELSDSIKNQGLLQPITLRPVNEKDITLGYEIVCGARRFKASQLAEMKQIPAIVRVMTDDEAFDAMITENLQRKDVEPIDEAIAFKILLEKGSSYEELASRFGKSEYFIRQRIKLNDLIDPFKEMLQKKELQVSHALELCKLEDNDQNKVYANNYRDEDSYYSWKNKSLKGLKHRLADRFNDLDKQEFDKTECDTCVHRCGANMLFQEFEANTCTKTECFENKIIQYEIFIALQKMDEGFILLVPGNKDSQLISELTSQGIEFSNIDLFEWRWPADEDSSNYAEQLELVAKGELKPAWVLEYWNEPKHIYAFPKATVSEDGTKSDTSQVAIATLQAKDKRNKEIQNEKTIADLRVMMQESKYKTKTKPLSDNEMNTMYAVILLKCDYRFTRDILNGEESDILNIVKDMSDKDRSKMVRDFINDLCTGSNSTYCKSTQAVLQSIASEAYPEETKGIELKHEETYLKRKEKIDQQIKAIEA